MRVLKNKYALAAFFLAAVMAGWIAFFHAPYFKPYTWWMTHNGQEYRLEAWHSHSPFTTDMVRFVLRHKNGGFAAVSPAGYLPGAKCTELRACRVSLYTDDGDPQIYPADEWVVDLATITPLPAPLQDADAGSPRFWTGGEKGFAVPADRFRITGNVCFRNLITTLLWLAGYLFAGIAVGYGAAYFHAQRKIIMGVLAAAPLAIGVAAQSTAHIVTYEGLAQAMGVAALGFIPLWVIAAVIYGRAMKRPADTRARTARNRALTCAFLAVFCIAFPFVQLSLLGSVADSPPVKITPAMLEP